jgi:hypothetical protein
MRVGIGIQGEYVLVIWPWVQELMSYDWFRKECYLMQGWESQDHCDSSYFVPKKRIMELSGEEIDRLL